MAKYCSVWYRCYATIERKNIALLDNGRQTIQRYPGFAKQPPITIDGLLAAEFSVGSASMLYSVAPTPAEGFQLIGVLQGSLRRDGAIVELKVDKSSVAGH
jgi:hypothetical protein